MLILSIIYIFSLIAYYYILRKYVIEEEDYIKDIELSTVILVLIMGIIPVINTYASIRFLSEMMKYKNDIAEKLLRKILFINKKGEK